MLTNTLVLGTHNPKKLKELEGLFCGTGIGVKSLAAFEAPIEVVEDGNSFRENAEKKASQQAAISIMCSGLGSVTVKSECST